MNSRHLTDMEIQQYTFDNENCEKTMVSHMSLCNTCKAKSEAYLLLSSGIRNAQQPVFDFNLSELVLLKLPSQKVKFSFTIFLVNSLATVAIILVCISIFLLKKYIINTFIDILPSFFYLIIVSAIAFVIFEIIDMYKAFQHKMIKLSDY